MGNYLITVISNADKIPWVCNREFGTELKEINFLSISSFVMLVEGSSLDAIHTLFMQFTRRAEKFWYGFGVCFSRIC